VPGKISILEYKIRKQYMPNWIFQGNPDKFDVDDYLKKTNQVYWSVTGKGHQKAVSIGDPVFIWRAQGILSVLD
jgi:hypothetical protein